MFGDVIKEIWDVRGAWLPLHDNSVEDTPLGVVSKIEGVAVPMVEVVVLFVSMRRK